MWKKAFEGIPGPAVVGVVGDLLDQAGIGVAAMDGRGHLTMLSPVLEQIFGEQLRPLPLAALPQTLSLYTEDLARHLLPVELPLGRARAGEVVRDAVVAVRRPEQPVRYLRCNAIPVPALSGDHRGALSLVHEVTCDHSPSSTDGGLQHHLVDWLNHELRTPLTVLLGHAELLGPLKLPVQVESSVTAMVRASQRLAALPDSLREQALRDGEQPQRELPPAERMCSGARDR